MPRVAVIPGDGIGPEVMREAVRVLEAVRGSHGLDLELTSWDLGADRYLREGTTITEAEFRSLRDDHDAILLGALGDPRVEDDAPAREILLALRSRLDLFINFRPCRLIDPALSPLKEVGDGGIEIEVFRENTEGMYVNLGGAFKQGSSDEVALQEDVNTRRGVERIVRAAFEHARTHGRPRVTLVDKANAMPVAGGLWRRVFAHVGAEFPQVARDAMYVDAMVMDLVRRPGRYSVVVTSNLFGDIISDLTAMLVGGLGLAPSANLHPGRHALFEPVHGSAPDIAGRGLANPLAAVSCVALLLDHLGFREAGRRVAEAVEASVKEGQTTPDLGGSLTTSQVGDWLCERLGHTSNAEDST